MNVIFTFHIDYNVQLLVTLLASSDCL